FRSGTRSDPCISSIPYCDHDYYFPRLPPTREEKMLLRLIHTVGPQELAMLNSEVRAKHEVEADAEFQPFFGQVTARNNEQN
ncbi:MAG: hypothetical protein WB919_12065, partial [Candidatus Sulfotelmatobacter sp.]